MPALDWITIKGFRSIASVERLHLGPINLLIGPNGAGKSNVVEAFSFLQAIRSAELQNYVTRVGGASKLLHVGVEHTNLISLEASFDGGKNQYGISLVATPDDLLLPESEWVGYLGEGYVNPYAESLSRLGAEAGISRPGSMGVAMHVRRHLERWRVYHFHDTSASSAMKRTADVDDNRYLRPDGSNIAAFLYLLQQKYPSHYDQIRESIRLVAPFFEDFRLQPQALNEDRIRLEWKHQRTTSYFDASSMSDGTLRFVLLATLFLQPEELRPSVILVDEPELGLHPFAINLLAALMKQASVTNQIFAATQSTILLDSFQPEDVLVANRDDGGTTLARLSSTELSLWMSDYSLGELWEKNYVRGRP